VEDLKDLQMSKMHPFFRTIAVPGIPIILQNSTKNKTN